MFEINSAEELEKLSFRVKWQYFEKLVGFIFKQNDFDVQHNVVISADKANKKRQFDVIAKKNNITYLAECKRIKNANDALLKAIVKKHKERCRFYKRVNKEDKESIVPLVVTPLNGILAEHKGVIIAPITSLNWLLNSS